MSFLLSTSRNSLKLGKECKCLPQLSSKAMGRRLYQGKHMTECSRQMGKLFKKEFHHGESFISKVANEIFQVTRKKDFPVHLVSSRLTSLEKELPEAQVRQVALVLNSLSYLPPAMIKSGQSASVFALYAQRLEELLPLAKPFHLTMALNAFVRVEFSQGDLYQKLARKYISKCSQSTPVSISLFLNACRRLRLPLPREGEKLRTVIKKKMEKFTPSETAQLLAAVSNYSWNADKILMEKIITHVRSIARTASIFDASVMLRSCSQILTLTPGAENCMDSETEKEFAAAIYELCDRASNTLEFADVSVLSHIVSSTSSLSSKFDLVQFSHNLMHRIRERLVSKERITPPTASFTSYPSHERSPRSLSHEKAHCLELFNSVTKFANSRMLLLSSKNLQTPEDRKRDTRQISPFPLDTLHPETDCVKNCCEILETLLPSVHDQLENLTILVKSDDRFFACLRSQLEIFFDAELLMRNFEFGTPQRRKEAHHYFRRLWQTACSPMRDAVQKFDERVLSHVSSTDFRTSPVSKSIIENLMKLFLMFARTQSVWETEGEILTRLCNYFDDFNFFLMTLRYLNSTKTQTRLEWPQEYLMQWLQDSSRRWSHEEKRDLHQNLVLLSLRYPYDADVRSCEQQVASLLESPVHLTDCENLTNFLLHDFLRTKVSGREEKFDDYNFDYELDLKIFDALSASDRAPQFDAFAETAKASLETLVEQILMFGREERGEERERRVRIGRSLFLLFALRDRIRVPHSSFASLVLEMAARVRRRESANTARNLLFGHQKVFLSSNSKTLQNLRQNLFLDHIILPLFGGENSQSLQKDERKVGERGEERREEGREEEGRTDEKKKSMGILMMRNQIVREKLMSYLSGVSSVFTASGDTSRLSSPSISPRANVANVPGSSDVALLMWVRELIFEFSCFYLSVSPSREGERGERGERRERGEKRVSLHERELDEKKVLLFEKRREGGKILCQFESANVFANKTLEGAANSFSNLFISSKFDIPLVRLDREQFATYSHLTNGNNQFLTDYLFSSIFDAKRKTDGDGDKNSKGDGIK